MAAALGSYDSERLRALLMSRTLKRDAVKGFTLASGARSPIYFNVKTTMMNAEGAALCGRGLLTLLKDLPAAYVGGLEMGAVPLLSVVAAMSAEAGRPVDSFFVRKKPKDHGTALTIEGLDELAGETLNGKHVVLIDDVATSGGSILQAVDQIRAVGGIVAHALVIVDRQQGADTKLADKGIALRYLFTAADLGVTEADLVPLA